MPTQVRTDILVGQGRTLPSEFRRAFSSGRRRVDGGGGWPRGAPPMRLTRNVVVLCAFSFLFHAGWSSWERNIFPVWVKNHVASGGKMLSVGAVQSLQGLVALVAAPLVGAAIDYGAAKPLVVLVVATGLCSSAALTWAFMRGGSVGPLLLVAISLWAVTLSGQGVVVDTTLAGSSAKGQDRVWAFSTKSTFWRAGGLAGQVVNLVVLTNVGNSWSDRTMVPTMLVGLGLCAAITLLLALRDPKAAGTEEPLLPAPQTRAARAPPATPRAGTPAPAPPGATGAEPSPASAEAVGLRSLECPAVAEASGPREGVRGAGAEPKGVEDGKPAACLTPPWVIFLAVVIRVLAKGMIMRFNPLLFTDVHGLSPVRLTVLVIIAQAISVVTPLASARLADALGPSLAMVLMRAVEPVALGVLGTTTSAAVAGAAFVALLGVPVGGRSVEKASLMNWSNASQRGRWNAVESINRSTWAGSAALGGFLLDHFGWKPVYLLASALSTLSLAVLALLVVGLPSTSRGARAFQPQ